MEYEDREMLAALDKVRRKLDLLERELDSGNAYADNRRVEAMLALDNVCKLMCLHAGRRWHLKRSKDRPSFKQRLKLMWDGLTRDVSPLPVKTRKQ